MAIKLGKWDFNKEMVSMGAAFLLWVVYQTYSVSQWKTKTDDMIVQLNSQTQSLSEQVSRQIPDHDKRIVILETQLPAIKSAVDSTNNKVEGVDRKLDVLIDKFVKVAP